jgi:NAD(P)-dependent dehydrogenase (short-subunit alcohol dehydrogenase family)
MRLQDKHAIVTGAASGLGAAITRRFVEEGAQVLAVDLAAHDGESSAGGSVLEVRADVCSATDLRRVVGIAEQRWGRIDILCNSAGINIAPAPLAETDEADFDRVMGVNARAVFLAMKHVIPVMVAGGGGAVINIASIGSFVAQSGFSAYYASKGACLMLTRAAAMDYAQQGVRVNAICPGVIDTPMLEPLGGAVTEPMKALHPVGRFGRPEEIAAFAVLLASDECTFATGASFVVDGGRTAT